MNTKYRNALWCAGLLCAGCGDDAETIDPDGEGQAVFAVHLRGDDAAGVALLDGEGRLLDDRLIDSGSVPPKLSALFTDIALPTDATAEPGVLAIVARTPNDSLLRVDIDDGEVLSEFSTQKTSDGAAFSSNPQDYLFLDEETAWVSRYEPNLDDSAGKWNEGDDLLKLNPLTGELLSTVSLEDFYETIDYEQTDWATGESTPLTGTAYARPGNLVRAGDFAFVGLDRLTIDFSGQAQGALAVLDLSEESAELLELNGLGNCGGLIPVLDRDDAVIVSCVGVPWGSADSAGVVLISVDEDGKLTEEQRFTPESDGPLAVFFPISMGGTEVVVAESGWATGGNDKLFRLDLDGGKPKRFYEAKEGGVVGFNGAYRPDTQLLLVGDRTEDNTGVRRFRMDQEVEELSMVKLDSSLPVDGVQALLSL